jgi:hypothetical protein
MSRHRTDKAVYVTDRENVKSIGILGPADTVAAAPPLGTTRGWTWPSPHDL